MWFTLALLSAVFAGVHAYGQKVVVERTLDLYLINALSALVSFVIALALFSFTQSWSTVPWSVYLFGALGGLLYIAYNTGRMVALRYIDSAIFFPLYKVVSPATIALIGIFIFSEYVTTWEVVGIIFSCLIPLLLITRHEDKRQKNLKLGLILLVATALAAAVSSAINSYVVRPDISLALPLLIVTHAFVLGSGLFLFLRQHHTKHMYRELTSHMTKSFIAINVCMGTLQFLAFYTLLLAFSAGDLSVVYAINAHYILIPVVLSVWFYGEHWNARKAFALTLSLAALVLLHH